MERRTGGHAMEIQVCKMIDVAQMLSRDGDSFYQSLELGIHFRDFRGLRAVLEIS